MYKTHSSPTKKEESFVLNGRFTTRYFMLGKGYTHQKQIFACYWLVLVP